MMNDIEPEAIVTGDGSQTLRHPLFGVSYRSTRGAVGESSHVFIASGLAALGKRRRVRILEVGFGSGLNALMTLRYAEQHGVQTDYTTVEAYRVAQEALQGLRYSEEEDFRALHAARWEMPCRITEHFTLTKYNTDFTRLNAPWEQRLYDLVYFDAFAPDVQPEMWDTDIFRRLHRVVVPAGMLVTYSAKGVVKQALRESGFTVERLPGALGKRHMLRATRL